MMTAEGMTEQEKLKAHALALLAEGQFEAAESIFVGLLRDHPQDVEAYISLGDCYRGGGDAETAVLLYTEALKIDPDHADLQRRRSDTVATIVESLATRLEDHSLPTQSLALEGGLPSDPLTVADLLQKLTGTAAPVSEADVWRAADLLHTVLSSPRPGQAVADHLEEIDDLLPALLELNIRQARADGRPDLAQGLETLLRNIQMQVNPPLNAPPAKSGRPQPAARRVLFLGPYIDEAPDRQALPAEALRALGYETTVAAQFPPEFQARFDLVVAHNPHADPRLLPGLAACAAANIPILLDLDAAYDHMPITHPDYPRLGLGTPGAAKAFRAALQLADRVVVPSEALAAILRAAGSSEVDVIPEGWTRANPLWEKPAARRHSLNIGWLGQGGGLDDVAPVRRMIVRVLREFQQTQLIVIGDPQVYQLFDSVPEARRLFLPAVKQEDYPYLLGQIDILIAPYRSTPFNQALSDHQLLEAGIRQIPWIASPLPAFTAWEAGGIIAQSPDEWHTHLRQLVLDPSLRQNLGRMGRLKAAGREMGALGRMWAELIEVCFAENILLE